MFNNLMIMAEFGTFYSAKICSGYKVNKIINKGE